LVLASIQRRLDGLLIEEFADLSKRDSPDLLFTIMGFGKPLTEIQSEGRLAHLKASFGPSLELVADALSMPLDEVVAHGELATVPRDIGIAAGTVLAGTVGGQRTTVSGLRDGAPVLQFRATWFCTTELEPTWDLRETGWKVTVAGDAPMDIEIGLPARLDQMAGYTANRAVNAVPYVCAAPPGLRSTVDLPQVIPTLGRPRTGGVSRRGRRGPPRKLPSPILRGKEPPHSIVLGPRIRRLRQIRGPRTRIGGREIWREPRARGRGLPSYGGVRPGRPPAGVSLVDEPSTAPLDLGEGSSLELRELSSGI
jgi:hypothetical protein